MLVMIINHEWSWPKLGNTLSKMGFTVHVFNTGVRFHGTVNGRYASGVYDGRGLDCEGFLDTKEVKRLYDEEDAGNR